MPETSGVLLINLGTPEAPTARAVRAYLREFLSDPRVIDTGPLTRAALVQLLIAPFRAPRSARQYRSVWTREGSPLLVHGRALADALAHALGAAYRVELGMRYGRPSLAAALERLVEAGVDRIHVVPLFPQYAASSTGSALQRVFEAAGGLWNVPPLDILPDFYDHPGFIAALAAVTRPVLENGRFDHLLLSYHGLPERQIRKSAPADPLCLTDPDCCLQLRPASRRCYRAQAFATSRALARELGLERERWSVSFQSRLGRTPWIRPFTDHVLPELAGRGVRRLAVACPSFVADCLETLEEIGIRARLQWREAGGESLELVPCVNAHPAWVDTLARMLRSRALPAPGPNSECSDP
ncbi:MAG: ferrochelatase [Proteobacteria bacterium]|nr:ferrochelatase [Pseudomonadota bacterium]